LESIVKTDFINLQMYLLSLYDGESIQFIMGLMGKSGLCVFTRGLNFGALECGLKRCLFASGLITQLDLL